MLPDFFSMMGIRNRVVDDPDLARGVEFHLETDALFHQTPTFIELNQNALNELRKRGVSRGPARACAHIGVEMLIDAVLIRDKTALREYQGALRIGAEPSSLFGSQSLFCSQVQRLCKELAERGEAAHLTSHERLVFRLGHTLRNRTRLCPTPQELDTIAKYLSECEEVERYVPQLLFELQPLLANDAD